MNKKNVRIWSNRFRLIMSGSEKKKKLGKNCFTNRIVEEIEQLHC